MVRIHFARTASLCASVLGALFNFAIAVQLLSAWRSLKWEPESEWEGSANSWRGGGVQLVWGLLSGYFAAAATVCLVGFIGIIKSIPSFVRFYRDYSIADFSFCTFFVVIGTYAAFRTSVRTVVCEELSRQPSLMRDLAEVGLNIENCELWFERAVLAFMMIMVVVIVARLHFLMALSNYYTYLLRNLNTELPVHTHWRSQAVDGSHQHIYLLPRPSTFHTTATSRTGGDSDILVYAPVPLSHMSAQQAQKLRMTATEAWISCVSPNSNLSSPSLRSHRHGHRRHGSHGSRGSSRGSIGRISLPVSPDEGLLPPYENSIRSSSPSIKA